VSEATSNGLLRKGHVYVAPGDYHLEIKRDNAGALMTRIHQGPKVNSVRPAADLLFKSAAEVCAQPCLCIVLTGMGDDGRAGAESIKLRDGYVFIQSEESCVVWGMPGSVFDSGYHDQIGDLKECQALINKFC
jgi:two-component system chemotaxis response regulator CheB